MIADAEPSALTGIVLTEILQGLRRDVSRIELSQWEMLEPKGFSTYRQAATIIFRSARTIGVAVTTTDALIAAITSEYSATLLTLDKHFAQTASIIRLPLYVF
jgi:predicted nucleic acid-binding protein